MNLFLNLFAPKPPRIVPKQDQPSIVKEFIQKHRLKPSSEAALTFMSVVSLLINNDTRTERCEVIIPNPKAPELVTVLTSNLAKLTGIPQTFKTSMYHMHITPNGRLVILGSTRSEVDFVLMIEPD